MKKIMIIEDDRVVATIYRSRLQNEGYEVEIILDGETAVYQIKKNPPDLVLLDLGLPKMNGIEVLKAIRTNPPTAALPVIVLSNSYVSELVQAAWKAGANKCLSKASCKPAELLEIIRTVFAQAAPPVSAPILEKSSTGGIPQASIELALPGSGSADGIFQAQVRQVFVSNGLNFVGDLRRRLQIFTQRGPGAALSTDLLDFYRSVHSLTGNAGIAGFTQIAQLSAALEALLKELYEKPKHIGPSPIRTVAHAIDALANLFQSAAVTPTDDALAPVILVLDDDVISRRTVCMALEKARLRSLSVVDPAIALKLLEENSFEMIFSDINMPGMNGFEFCAKVRELPKHKLTPVIFVTSASDFETRANSKLSGGTDLIGKPFLLVELAVKALTFLSRNQGATST